MNISWNKKINENRLTLKLALNTAYDLKNFLRFVWECDCCNTICNMAKKRIKLGGMKRDKNWDKIFKTWFSINTNFEIMAEEYIKL